MALSLSKPRAPGRLESVRLKTRETFYITARELRGRKTMWLGEQAPLEKQAIPRGEPFMEKTNISLPHRRAIWWLLNIAHLEPYYDFIIEVPLFGAGGRAYTILPDVMLLTAHPGGILAWEIQGLYYHGKQWQRYHDQLRRERLLKARIMNMPIKAVVFLWESDICQSDDQRNRACELGMSGLEIKQ